MTGITDGQGSSPSAPDPGAAAVVDVHAHMVPPGLLGAVAEGELPGVTLQDTEAGPVLVAGADRLGPIGTGMLDARHRLASMDDRGIDEQWISPWLDLFTWHRFGPDDGQRWCAAVNDTLGELTGTSNGRLVPVPAVDWSGGPAAAAERLAVAVEEMAAPAAIVNSNPHGAGSLADDQWRPLWDVLDRAGAAALLHPPADGPASGFLAPILHNVAGRPIDTTATILDLMTAGLFEAFDTLHVIAVHGGGFLPYQAYRLDGLGRAGLLGKTSMTRSVADSLRRLWFDTVGLDDISLELLVRRVGADRVLLGSDAPFPIGDPDPVGTVRRAAIAEDAKHAICCANARSLTAGPAAAQASGSAS